MEKLKAFIKKYYEGFAYLFFGGLATLLNLVLFAVFQAVLGTGFGDALAAEVDIGTANTDMDFVHDFIIFIFHNSVILAEAVA